MSDQLDALLEIHDKVDWPRVPYGQGHHYDRTDRANASPGRREDFGGPGSGNWIRIDPVTFKSLQLELMRGQAEPVARRRLFAELGVSEDELPKLVKNAELVAGVKSLKAAADAGATAPVTATPMVVEVPSVEVAPTVVQTPVATATEGDPVDSDGGSVPSDAPAAPVAGVEEDLVDYE